MAEGEEGDDDGFTVEIPAQKLHETPLPAAETEHSAAAREFSHLILGFSVCACQRGYNRPEAHSDQAGRLADVEVSSLRILASSALRALREFLAANSRDTPTPLPLRTR